MHLFKVFHLLQACSMFVLLPVVAVVELGGCDVLSAGVVVVVAVAHLIQLAGCWWCTAVGAEKWLCTGFVARLNRYNTWVTLKKTMEQTDHE